MRSATFTFAAVCAAVAPVMAASTPPQFTIKDFEFGSVGATFAVTTEGEAPTGDVFINFGPYTCDIPTTGTSTFYKCTPPNNGQRVFGDLFAAINDVKDTNILRLRYNVVSNSAQTAWYGTQDLQPASTQPTDFCVKATKTEST